MAKNESPLDEQKTYRLTFRQQVISSHRKCCCIIHCTLKSTKSKSSYLKHRLITSDFRAISSLLQDLELVLSNPLDERYENLAFGHFLSLKEVGCFLGLHIIFFSDHFWFAYVLRSRLPFPDRRSTNKVTVTLT